MRPEDQLNKIKDLELELKNPNLDLFEKLDIKDQILDIKMKYQVIKPLEKEEDCENCSA